MSKLFDEATASHETTRGAPGSRARVFVIWEGGATHHDLPESGRVVFGRGQDCDVQIDHTSVSRRHMALIIDGGFRIEDLGSANGTRIGDRKLGAGEVVTVEPGSQVRVGGTTIILPARPAETASAASAAALEPGAPAGGPAMSALYRTAGLVAKGRIPVLILGETGVGKDVVARYVHRASPRAELPFVRLDCSSLGEAVLESELFGVEARAGTESAIGLLEATNGGTLFLDNVAELPLAVQSKLLLALENGEVVRIGGVRPQRVDVRFLAATNKDLDALVASGQFRSDLYFRLHGAKLVVPPLRTRRDEIVPLATSFADEAAKELGRNAPGLSSDAIATLAGYDWPGNVRQLKHVISRAVLLAAGPEITVADLGPLDALNAAPPAVMASAARPANLADLKGELQALEKERILTALAQCEGNQSRAAKLLGITRRALIVRLEAHQIPRPRKRTDEP